MKKYFEIDKSLIEKMNKESSLETLEEHLKELQIAKKIIEELLINNVGKTPSTTKGIPFGGDRCIMKLYEDGYIVNYEYLGIPGEDSDIYRSLSVTPDKIFYSEQKEKPELGKCLCPNLYHILINESKEKYKKAEKECITNCTFALQYSLNLLKAAKKELIGLEIDLIFEQIKECDKMKERLITEIAALYLEEKKEPKYSASTRRP